MLDKLLWKITRKNPSYLGNYTTMKEASEFCKGYATEEIFDKVKQAAIAVKNGDACYERDSCLFYDHAINYNLMMYLYRMAYKNRMPIELLDWGGSLGSTYFQHKEIINKDKLVKCWTVVEQPHFVDFGKKNLEDNILKFKYTDNIDEIVNETNFQCILFSAVLHYLDDYRTIIKKVCNYNAENIILERTPVCKKDMICIEQVKEPIYSATYPMQIFSEERLKSLFAEEGYYVVDEWKSLVDGKIFVNNEEVMFKSYVFER